MANKTLKVMGVHGLGDFRDTDWHTTWTAAVNSTFPQMQGLSLDFQFVTYDDIFEDIHLSLADSVSALWKLTKSGISDVGHRQRGVLSTVSDKIKWTAGYVVAWVENDSFQMQSRKRILDSVRQYQPDIVLAHSLGSLVTYNAFTHSDAESASVRDLLAKVNYVTLGSQIANPFVVGNLTNGRIQPLSVQFWHHLFNIHDDVFTAPIRVPEANNFRQTETPFDIEGVADHAAESYLSHLATKENVWRPIGEHAINARSFGPSAVRPRRVRGARAAPSASKRALLVGINDYPDPANRLEGCVNDVFTMSSVLQECGFPPETIRTCLDNRATTQGILDRMQWLLDDPKPGDELVFYYSGHGTRIPEYGNNYEPDHHVESLVPWDFDWSLAKAITDDHIYQLYSQLPYDCRLLMVFDCCHSGGIHKDGGGKPRGIAPPDDIRHRELKWDQKTSMWVPRSFTRLTEGFSSDKKAMSSFLGREGTTKRLGRASMLRPMKDRQYRQLKKRNPKLAKGPYLPVIMEACGEQEFSYEYRHGATSHGAFTYCLASILRKRQSITFENLMGAVKDQLTELQYNQVPQILGPKEIITQKVPWKAS